jgi:hypothetical protein
MRCLAYATAGCLLLLGATAHAEPSIAAPGAPQPIWGGTVVEACGWPTTVYMGGCTGTLVHPEVVVFASHCMFFGGGNGPAFASFGETIDQPAREVATQSCTMFPGWIPDESGLGKDVAFCVLAEPVVDVPIVPILMGCETEVLAPGQEITLVGYGVTNDGSTGIKHEVITTINALEGEAEINVGGSGTSSCNGDSGGPAYVRLLDGAFRVFGVTSRGISGSCADASIYGLIHRHVQWIEDTSGIDVTPCHDADGTWNPTDACTELPLDPGLGSATGWRTGCAGGLLSGPSVTCGNPFGEEGTGTTGEADTGLDDSDSGSSSDTGLPGGTAADTTTGTAMDSTTTDGDGSTSTDTAGTDDDTTTCSCRADAPFPRALVLLLLAAPLTRRRRAR